VNGLKDGPSVACDGCRFCLTGALVMWVEALRQPLDMYSWVYRQVAARSCCLLRTGPLQHNS
jgi:hypothetical protein